MGTEARGVVIPERPDELEERSLWIRKCGRSRDPHTGTAAGRVALELGKVASISKARREYRVGRCLADDNAVGDRLKACENTADRRAVGTLDLGSFGRELAEGDDVGGADRCGFW